MIKRSKNQLVSGEFIWALGEVTITQSAERRIICRKSLTQNEFIQTLSKITLT